MSMEPVASTRSATREVVHAFAYPVLGFLALLVVLFVVTALVESVEPSPPSPSSTSVDPEDTGYFDVMDCGGRC